MAPACGHVAAELQILAGVVPQAAILPSLWQRGPDGRRWPLLVNETPSSVLWLSVGPSPTC
jgi:hypothetical protein